MKKKVKKQLEKKIKKGSKNPYFQLLLAIGLLSLFSETMRTIPAGAISEKFINMPYELPKLNSVWLKKVFRKFIVN